jgi:hypothetical protein
MTAHHVRRDKAALFQWVQAGVNTNASDGQVLVWQSASGRKRRR